MFDRVLEFRHVDRNQKAMRLHTLQELRVFLDRMRTRRHVFR